MKLFCLSILSVIAFITSSLAFAQNLTPTAAVHTGAAKTTKAHNLIFILDRAGVFEVFLAAIRQAGLEEKLSREGGFTLLAPTDAAFAHVGSIPRQDIFASKTVLKKFVEQHILPGRLSLADLVKLDSVACTGGTMLPIEQKDPLEIGHAKVLRADIEADNGLIHLLGKASLQE